MPVPGNKAFSIDIYLMTRIAPALIGLRRALKISIYVYHYSWTVVGDRCTIFLI